MSDKKILDCHKITHILNVTSDVRNKFEAQIVFKQIKVNDLPSVRIDSYFAESFEFIESALDASCNSVLVHCHAGVSRSASFIIAYLMQKEVCGSYEEAYELIRRIRFVRPNDGFIKQLKSLENELIKM